MSLFQFGFSISSTQQQTPHEPKNIALAATHLPDQEDAMNTIKLRLQLLISPDHSLYSRGVGGANIISIAERTVPKLPNIQVSMETRKSFNIFLRYILI